MSFRAGIASVLALLAGCTFTVTPSDTHPGTNDGRGDHIVVVPERIVHDELFVWFPGSGGKPDSARALLEAVGDEGMRAIGLAYENVVSVHDLCLGSTDPQCPAKVRGERLDGIDRTDLVDVDPVNSIAGRLYNLLTYLDSRYPNGGWDAYLDGSEPRWDRIVVAGASQGSGMAAMIAKHRLVARVVMFAGVFDVDPTTFAPPHFDPAPWITTGHVTPSDRYYGFGHVDDNAQVYLANWAELGVPGPVASVDQDDPPYGGAHALQTARAASTPHGSWKRPIFEPVWRYTCCYGLP